MDRMYPCRLQVMKRDLCSGADGGAAIKSMALAGELS
jgi:hypothetical protein